ncbi:hypothetical protein ABC0190 [Shouchella clausii KSM-K16]|uniref:Uncharacterized protein n=1 Tax=Shouchella clausii (strain KSM-K16) TaxID=66692 RepID=Q5WLM2_SHOC1|nr:hypothetical protein ABC0190 [Shouchella clausii KSM-K16]
MNVVSGFFLSRVISLFGFIIKHTTIDEPIYQMQMESDDFRSRLSGPIKVHKLFLKFDCEPFSWTFCFSHDSPSLHWMIPSSLVDKPIHGIKGGCDGNEMSHPLFALKNGQHIADDNPEVCNVFSGVQSTLSLPIVCIITKNISLF